MKSLSKVLVVVCLLVAGSLGAMADTMWTLNDVAFDNGNVATGWFLVNPALNAFDAYSLMVTGPDTAAAFTATIVVDAYLPNTVGFAGPGFAEFAVLYLSTPLTNAGGIVPIASGFDCPPIGGCGTLLLANSGHNPELIGVTPEPTSLLLLGSGLGSIAFLLRRKLL